MIFDPVNIGDHATKPTRKMASVVASSFGASTSMDSFTRGPGRRVARSVTGSPSEGPQKALQKAKHAPFWQLAPDGKTIERTYRPEEEPLIETPK